VTSGEVSGRTLKIQLCTAAASLSHGDAFRFEPVTRKGECHSHLQLKTQLELEPASFVPDVKQLIANSHPIVSKNPA
jgi:hypothetical protein